VNAQGMKFWKKELAGLGLPFIESQGNFLLTDPQAWIGRTGAQVQIDCLKRGLILRPVTNYGLPHHLRISIGTPAENRFAVGVLRGILKEADRVRKG
jgi:histidinol-phosphate aminotransferase